MLISETNNPWFWPAHARATFKLKLSHFPLGECFFVIYAAFCFFILGGCDINQQYRHVYCLLQLLRNKLPPNQTSQANSNLLSILSLWGACEVPLLVFLRVSHVVAFGQKLNCTRRPTEVSLTCLAVDWHPNITWSETSTEFSSTWHHGLSRLD